MKGYVGILLPIFNPLHTFLPQKLDLEGPMDIKTMNCGMDNPFNSLLRSTKGYPKSMDAFKSWDQLKTYINV